MRSYYRCDGYVGEDVRGTKEVRKELGVKMIQ